MRHGARSEAVVRRQAGYIKQSVLQPLGIRQAELSAVARRYLDLYARCLAKVQLMDAWVEQHGWVDEAGNLPGFSATYFAALNAARLALREFEKHVEIPEVDPFDVYRGLQPAS
jgi:hypothetical protein